MEKKSKAERIAMVIFRDPIIECSYNRCLTIARKILRLKNPTPAIDERKLVKLIEGFKPNIIIYKNNAGGVSETIDKNWKNDLAKAIVKWLKEGRK